MAFVEDRRAFFTDFGVPAVVGGVALTGIFDAAYADALGIGGSAPVLTIDTDATTPAYGAAVTVAGVSYTVAEIQPDGTGMTRLLLERV